MRQPLGPSILGATVLCALVGSAVFMGAVALRTAPSTISAECTMRDVPLRALSNDLLNPQLRAQHIAESDDAHMTLWGAGYELKLGVRWTHFIANILGLDLVDWEIQSP